MTTCNLDKRGFCHECEVCVYDEESVWGEYKMNTRELREAYEAIAYRLGDEYNERGMFCKECNAKITTDEDTGQYIVEHRTNCIVDKANKWLEENNNNGKNS